MIWESEAFWGALIGFIGGFFLMFILVFTSSSWNPNTILSRTDNGVICKADEYYPKLNCEELYKALGPRLSKLEKEK